MDDKVALGRVFDGLETVLGEPWEGLGNILAASWECPGCPGPIYRKRKAGVGRNGFDLDFKIDANSI